MDFDNYPHWNPFIKSIKGTPDVGQTITVTLQLQPGKSYTFTPVVQAFIPGELFAWKGKLLVPGLFDGGHRFVLTPQGQKTQLVQEEHFSGLLTHILPRHMFEMTRKGFVAMNQALKEQAEA